MVSPNCRSQLIGVEGLYKEEEFYLEGDSITIGRDSTCEHVLSDKKVSRKHARFEWDGDTYWIQDLNSTNGVFVNGFPVTKSRLQDNDKLVIGGTVFLFNNKSELIKKDLSGKVVIDNEFTFQEGQAIFVDSKEAYKVKSGKTDDLSFEHQEVNHERYAIMLRVANVLSSSFKLSEILEKIMKEIFSIFPVDRGLIMFFDNDELVPKVVWNREKADLSSEIVISKTLIDKVINEKQSVCTSDIRDESIFVSSESILCSDIRSVMCVPIICKDEVLGLIQIDTKTSKHSFSRNDLELFTGISYQAGIAIENSRLYNRLETEAAIRGNLSRYLPVNLVEDIISGHINLGLGGELREATILFSDIRGFTKASEKMKPQEVVRFLNEYLTAMSEIVFDYNGMIDKFIGDAIMAIFGGPWTDNDGIEDSVNTALEMIEVMADLNNKWATEGRPLFHIGIGINWGKVVLGNIGSSERMEYTAIGDTVNTASRLVSLAKPDQIVISEQIFEKVKFCFDINTLPPAFVKGKEKPLQVYEVIKRLENENR